VTSAAPGWYADPFGRHEVRYFDGAGWTEHVASHGRPATDAPGAPGAPGVPAGRRTGFAAGEAAYDGGGSLFDEPVLVVSQKAKLIEVSNEYALYDRHARQVGAVRQVGQSGWKKAARVLTSYDQFMTHKLQVLDHLGRPVLAITRPAKLLRSRLVVQDPAGEEVGQVVQQNVVGRIRFALLAGGEQVGSVNAENWRAWNFSIRDADDLEVARITKTWEGLARTLFTTADTYVVQVHRPLQGPLRPLVVAAAVCVDTALKQDRRGLG
jgi:uncharacterized protein YxjI